ncbi:unnamed protein product [Calicophoron daubneyi]|uniref:PHD-type domain-containing protein n=1 Tax=Calicophoron daubneyi TaxID=300641 RepID=A0AAV2TNM4_CALDB
MVHYCSRKISSVCCTAAPTKTCCTGYLLICWRVSAMSVDSRRVMSQAIAQICIQVGFERITESSLDFLIDVTEQYMRNLACNIRKIADICDGQAKSEDALLSLRLMGQSPEGLLNFIKEVGAYFSAPPLFLCGPLGGKICLNIPPENHSELDTRPSYIPQHLPLDYCSSSTVDSALHGSADILQNSETRISNRTGAPSNAHSVTNTHVGYQSNGTPRSLPPWAGQVSYCLARVSVDPGTGCLIEHSPPDRPLDASPEPTTQKIHLNRESSVTQCESQFGLPFTLTSVSSAHVPSSSRTQGASDAQWAAALQTAPALRLPKRIVYTPSRFDPSAVSSCTSSIRRSLSGARRSVVPKRPIYGSLNLHKKRPAPSVCAQANKIAKICSTSKGRRHGSVSRARKWMKNNRCKKKTRESLLALPTTNFKEDKEDDKIHSNTADSASPIQTEISPFGPSFPAVGAEVTLDSGSDRTPRAESPTAAMRLVKMGGSGIPLSPEMPYSHQVSPTSADKEVSELQPANVEKLVDVSAAKPSLPVSPAHSHTDSESIKPELPVASEPNPLPSQRSDNKKHVPSQVKKKMKSRRKPPPRPSIISSLFQNPLRQKRCTTAASGKTSSVQSCQTALRSRDDSRSSASKATVNHPLNVTKPSTVRSTSSSRSYRKNLPVHKSPFRSSLKTDKSPRACKTSVRNETPTLDLADDVNKSPASDCTEPMMDEARAKMLEFPHVETGDISFKGETDFHPKADGHGMATTGILPDQDSALNSFTGRNFGNLRLETRSATHSVPSSPSSIDSLLSSSASSTSTSTLTKLLSDKNTQTAGVGHDVRPLLASAHVSSADTRTVNSGEEPVQSSSPTTLTSNNQANPSSSSSLVSFTRSPVDSRKKMSTVSPCIQPALRLSPNPAYPPPLIPLGGQSRTTVASGNLVESKKVVVPDDIPVPPPPALVPVSDVASEQQRPERTLVDSSGKPQKTEPVSQPSATATGSLRIKIRFGASEARETLASSLSSSSSSSSLSSSGSTPTSPYVPTRSTFDPALLKEDPCAPFPEVVTEASGKKPSSALETSVPTKAPKLVIRLGNSSNASSRLANQLATFDKPAVAACAGVDSNKEDPIVSRNQALPPPLQLTISRNRLSYRRSTGQVSDSNGSSSSSGTESSLSSDEDGSGLPSPNVRSTSFILATDSGKVLPPPPSLERLPDRSTATDNSSSFPPAYPHQPSPDHSLASVRANNKPEVVKSSALPGHEQLPPLLPLFSRVPLAATAVPDYSLPPRLSVIGLDSEHSELATSALDQTDGPKRKRYRSGRRRHGPNPKRRLISSENSSEIAGSPSTVHSEPQHCDISVRQPRARVDSVFTDDESAGEDSTRPGLEADKHSTVGGPVESQINKTDAVRTHLSRKTSKLDVLSSAKRPKGRPRTKHAPPTAGSKTSYPPAVKPAFREAAVNPQSVPGRSLDCVRSKQALFSSSASAARHLSSQVIASGGSSYYFNNSGEQIWLCPICLLEDDGNLMIGCDSCDDWYHSSCLGLSGEPLTSQWFCPKCTGQPLPAGPVNITCNAHPLVAPVQSRTQIPKPSINGPSGRRKEFEISSGQNPAGSGKGPKRRLKK